MTFIDTNLTYSKQVCDLAVGGYMGIVGVLYVLWKIAILSLGFYLIYRITKIFMNRKKLEGKK